MVSFVSYSSIYKYWWKSCYVPNSSILPSSHHMPNKMSVFGGEVQRTTELFFSSGTLLFCGACMTYTWKSARDSFQHNNWFVQIFIWKYFLENCQSCKGSAESSCGPFTWCPPNPGDHTSCNHSTVSRPGNWHEHNVSCMTWIQLSHRS